MGLTARRPYGATTALLVLLPLAWPAATAGTAATDAPVPSPPSHPRTVLVLSGGGARGMAHIGVLEVLEELQVPVDAIVGASMGAIVGGMYASGLSPKQMRTELLKIDWLSTFNDEPARKYLPYRRKEEDNVPLFKFEAGFNKHGFSLPSGIVAGQKLNFILRTMLLHTAATSSFDALPIPFRAVATDLDTGEAVVLSRGDLPEAIRASMAFPVLFTPVRYDGHLLIDGGVVRNLPLDVALDMGAERIIAVDVGSRLEELEETSPSAMQVLRRTSSIQSQAVRAEVLDLLRKQDILITPALDGKVTFSDFAKVDAAIALGRDAAQGASGRLRELADPGPAYESFLRRQRAGVDFAPVRIDSIKVEGLQRVPEARILRRIRTRPGDTLDLQALQGDLERIYLIGEFQTVEFRLEPDGDETRLVISAAEKSWGPWYTRAGLGLHADFAGSGTFVANLLVRRVELNRLGAEWRTLVTLGNENLVHSDLYQPVSQAGTWFVGAELFLRRDNNERVTVADQPVTVVTRIAQGGLDVGRKLAQWGEVRLGVYGGQADNTIQAPVGEEDSSALGGVRLRLGVDRLDDPYFPRHGTWALLRARASREQLGADEEYDRLELNVVKAGSFGRNTILGKLRVGSDFDTGLPFYDDFELGGFLNLSGLAEGELRGQHVGFAALAYYRRLNREPGLFGSNYFLGLSLEMGNVWSDEDVIDVDSLRPAGSLFFGADTLLGPVYIAYGRGEGGSDTGYFFLGRVF